MTPRCTHKPEGKAAKQAAAIAAIVPALETERLRLRAPRIDDLAGWGEAWRTLNDDATDEELWHEFCVYAAGWMLHGHGVWSVESRDNGALVGFVMLGLEWGDAEPEIGWTIRPDHRRQGYAAEAARAVQEFALNMFGEGGAVSYVALDNAPSTAVARSIGAWRDHAAEARFPHETQIWRHGGAA